MANQIKITKVYDICQGCNNVRNLTKVETEMTTHAECEICWDSLNDVRDYLESVKDPAASLVVTRDPSLQVTFDEISDEIFELTNHVYGQGFETTEALVEFLKAKEDAGDQIAFNILTIQERVNELLNEF